MNDEWKSFCRILRKVIDQWSFKSDKYPLSSDVSVMRREVEAVIHPYANQVHYAQTLMYHPQTIDLPSEKVVVFLDPPESAGQLLLPVLTLKGDKESQRIDVKVVLTFFMRADRENLRAIAYRFERGDDDTHGYFHAQLTEKWCLGGEADVDDHIPGIPKWLPTSVPAVPVDASQAIHAITSAVISIYGKDKTLKALWKDLKRDEEKILSKMNVVDSYNPSS